MALIIEDGSNVPDANSYADLAYIRQFALIRGVTLSAVDSELEIQVHNAMDYFESRRSQFQGSKTNDDQSLQWPRTAVQIDCVDFDEDSIPVEVLGAESQLVIEIHNGVNLYESLDAGEQLVTKEKVDVIETTYSEGAGVRVEARLPKVNRYLMPLYYPCGWTPIKNVRV